MQRKVSLVLLGFTAFERAVFAAELRLGNDLAHRYRLVSEPTQADFVIADADDDEAVATLVCPGLAARTLAIGERPVPGVALSLPPPMRPDATLRAVAALVGEEAATLPPLAAPVADDTPSTQVRRVLDQLAGMRVRPQPLNVHALAVAQDERLLRQLATQLPRLGLQVRVARNGPEALRRLARMCFEYVFVAADLEGIDGFQVCRAVRAQPVPSSARPPSIVLLARTGTPADRVRGYSAGCDAVLEPPLDADSLLRVVGAREVRQMSFVRTAPSDTVG